jgi:uncharacterized FlaG/YvyC family protein
MDNKSRDTGNTGSTRHRTKKIKTATQKTKKMSNTNSAKTQRLTQVLSKCKHFLSPIILHVKMHLSSTSSKPYTTANIAFKT